MLDMERNVESSPGGGMARNSFNKLVSSASVRYDTKPEDYDILSSTGLKLEHNGDKCNTDMLNYLQLKKNLQINSRRLQTGSISAFP